MPTILITGGTGLIGKAITTLLLGKGYEVIILTRNPDKQKPVSSGISYAGWDIEKQIIDKAVMAKSDYIVHLAGAGLAEARWTKKRKKEILDSRVKSSQLIIETLRSTPNKVKAVVSASAIGWYGSDRIIPNPKPFTENLPASNDFLGKTCKQWEESIEPVIQLGKRLVKLRMGIVLSREGGVLKKLFTPLKFGMAAISGSGKQIFSWIYIDDLAKMFFAAIENEIMNGVYNAVAPNPVSNKELVTELAKSRKKFFVPFHVPSFLLRLIFGEMSIEILKSTTVSSEKVRQTGFVFAFPDIKIAFEHNT